ncbi:Autophagy protein 5, partial [Teratosphaeriaceae sp. CCFEE 6253]
DVPLKWHYPAGLLYDLYSGAAPVDLDRRRREVDEAAVEGRGAQVPIPWRLTLHYTDFPAAQLILLDADADTTLRDTFTNAMKEADCVRNGTARTAMGLSKADADTLWHAVLTHDRARFNAVHTKLLHPPGLALRHVPLKLYLPTSSTTTPRTPAPSDPHIPEEAAAPPAAHLRVVQPLIPLRLPASRQTPQTLGTALHTTLPALFPSRRTPLLALPVLHGAVVPLGADLVELSAGAGYVDGFLHVVVVMLG